MFSLRFAFAAATVGATATLALANTAIEPVARDPKWVARHEGFVELAKRSRIDVLFLGDSITDFWREADPEKGGKAIWDREFAPLRAANFGISADRTQHVLWRIQNGELDGLRPKVVVLMIGTNNTGFERDDTTPRNTPTETVEGIKAILDTLREKLPESKILLLGVFPRGEKSTHPQRLQVQEINRAISRFADREHIRFLDIGEEFLAPNGNLPKDVMPDFLHPNRKGYQIWATAIKRPLAAMLSD